MHMAEQKIDFLLGVRGLAQAMVDAAQKLRQPAPNS